MSHPFLNFLRRNSPHFSLLLATLLLFSACSTPRIPQADWESGIWIASDGHKMPFSEWPATHNPTKAEIFIVHGLAGRDEDFLPLIDPLTSAGYRVVGINLRGLGMEAEDKDKGHLKSWHQWIADLNEFATILKQRNPEVPRFLMGESLGAVLSIHLAGGTFQDNSPAHHWQGLILLSPVIEVEGEVNFWQRTLFRLLRTVAPRYRINPENFIDEDKPRPQVTRDLERRKYLNEAPHFVDRFTIGFLGGVFSAIQNVDEAWHSTTQPVFIAHAGKDIFIKTDSVRSFFQRERPTDAIVERLFFPESYHLLMFDPVTPELTQALLYWLEANNEISP